METGTDVKPRKTRLPRFKQGKRKRKVPAKCGSTSNLTRDGTYSTVTAFARFRGLSTSHPRSNAA